MSNPHWLAFITCVQFMFIGTNGLTQVETNSDADRVMELVKNKVLKLEITGRSNENTIKTSVDGDGLYYGKCITFSFENLSNKSIQCGIDLGQLLLCADTAVQDMIVTKPLYVELHAREKRDIASYAMCCEFHDGVPSTSWRYTLGSKVDPDLYALTLLIDKNCFQDIVGQSAVWAYTDSVSSLDLMTHGASLQSLLLSASLLNEAGLQVSFNNEETFLHPESSMSNTPIDKLGEPRVKVPNNESMHITIICILGIALLVSLYFLFFQRPNRFNSI